MVYHIYRHSNWSKEHCPFTQIRLQISCHNLWMDLKFTTTVFILPTWLLWRGQISFLVKSKLSLLYLVFIYFLKSLFKYIVIFKSLFKYLNLCSNISYIVHLLQWYEQVKDSLWLLCLTNCMPISAFILQTYSVYHKEVLVINCSDSCSDSM